MYSANLTDKHWEEIRSSENRYYTAQALHKSDPTDEELLDHYLRFVLVYSIHEFFVERGDLKS